MLGNLIHFMVNKRSNIYLLTKGSTQEEGENAQEGAG